MKCEAQALGREIEPIPVCDEIAVEERHGFNLCEGCAQAFDTFIEIGERVVDEFGEAGA